MAARGTTKAIVTFPSIAPRSETLKDASHPSTHSDRLVDETPTVDEAENIDHLSNLIHDMLRLNRPSSSSADPCQANAPFNIESFDPIRTIGTGKTTGFHIHSGNHLISGTFGRVQLVCHRDTNAYYALKIMSITRIIESKQVEHVRNEKNILSLIDHPFLVRLQWTTHTNASLYLLLEYLPGGELFQMMRKREKFDVKTAVFYASEVLLGLDYLHHLDILYRDLKPVRRHRWYRAILTYSNAVV